MPFRIESCVIVFNLCLHVTSLKIILYFLLHNITKFFLGWGALQPNEGHGLLIHEIFLDHTQRRTIFGRTPLDQ